MNSSGQRSKAEGQSKIESFEDLLVWQKSISLVETLYEITAKFPAEEKFNLTSQLRRAAVSVPSNIAEGYSRKSLGDYIRFLLISVGSLAEIKTQLVIANRLNFLGNESMAVIKEKIVEIDKMLRALVKSLEKFKIT